LIDTHCHLENDAFAEDLDIVIQRASEKGIHIITSSIEKERWAKCCKIASAYKNVYCSIGLDPMQYEDYPLAVEKIRSTSNQLVAIGEAGLDHFYLRDHKERDKQEIAFRNMISVANEIKLPIQVHSRSAGAKAITVLKDAEANGKASYARTASNDLGYYFSIPTSVVRSPQKKKLTKGIAIERLLLETDSPVLGAEREERNEPANLGIALREVASILRREEEELREIILENTLRLYKRINSH